VTRRDTTIVVLGLLLLGALAPGLEALTTCVQPCLGDDANDGCTRDMCCSCCMHVGPAALSVPTTLSPVRHSSAAHPQVAGRVLSAEPRGLLHVPKPGLL
jgi:hypothetical protein